MRVLSIAYHDIGEDWLAHRQDPRGAANVYRLGRPAFQAHLQSIIDRGAAQRVRTLGRPQHCISPVPVLLTFDDGAETAYLIAAEELERHGWRGHFFVVTKWIGRPGFLDVEQIRSLHARGHVIGSHTHSHPRRMSELEWADMLWEWSESCAALSDILGEPVTVASVANGFYSRRVAEAAAAAGIEILFNSEPTPDVDIVDGTLVLGRYSVHRKTHPGFSGAVAAGKLWPRWRQAQCWQFKKMLKSVAGRPYASIRRHVLCIKSLT
jgi:peptidoglycan/xylan/chitin deacetylase (PgdA/CDA1 family)